MAIKEVIQTINQMQADGVMERYAIGGAVGATFYLEPVATLGVGIFVAFRDVLARHGLLDAWHKFERQFLSDIP
jgi:tetrahydromethanopterin S-methyltransferase subunit A